jgi:hypothetical protein
MAPQLLQNVEDWILAESQNRDPAPSLHGVRRMARMMMGLEPE